MADYQNANGYALDWDSEIEYTESSFVILRAGTYPFTVQNFERQNYDGTGKIPPCKMAVLHISVDGGDQGTAMIDERLYLHSSMMWKLSEFFTAIGQLQKDGTARMNWNAVPGATGQVKISVNQYKNRNGEDRTNNRVEHFLPPDQNSGAREQKPNSAPGWTPGKF